MLELQGRGLLGLKVGGQGRETALEVGVVLREAQVEHGVEVLGGGHGR